MGRWRAGVRGGLARRLIAEAHFMRDAAQAAAPTSARATVFEAVAMRRPTGGIRRTCPHGALAAAAGRHAWTVVAALPWAMLRRCAGRAIFDGVRYDELATTFFAAFLVMPFPMMP